MPRQARIDIAGQLYHVMSRGIERREIFLDDEDYGDFLERFSAWLNKTGGKCLAWCLMPNHFHFLILRGSRPLSELMHRAMTGYAVNFNLRHRRAGHLFQNRYKAIICDLESYLLEAVPYIHLNPLRAGLVPDLAGLEKYRWCGHGSVTTGVPDELIARRELLSHFGEDEDTAVAKYKKTVEEKWTTGGQIDLSGGGLLRSYSGGNAVLRAFRAGEKVFSDQRVLGDSDFVESLIRATENKENKVKISRAEVLTEVEALTGMNKQDIFRHTRERGPARARALYCHLAREEAGSALTELARELGLTESAVSKLALKGRALAANPE